VGMDRYHVPLDPMLAIFVGYALTRFVRQATVHSRKRLQC